jgi:hypothetical protein
MRKLVKESLADSPDLISLLWDFWNQSRIKNRPGTNMHDSQDDFDKYCKLMKNEIDKFKCKPEQSTWQETPRGPRGDMDPESWGDKPDWRGNEMGG